MKSRLMIAVILLLGALLASASAADDVVVHKKKDSKKQGWLGVSIQDVTPRLARDNELKVKEGAYVNEVIDDSPADSVGMDEGDIITEYNGKKIELAEDLTKEVRDTKPGTKVNLVVNRKGEKKTFTVNIRKNKMHMPFAMSVPHPMAMPHMKKFIMHRSNDLEGMDLLELNKQLGEYFEVPNGRGMLVNEVDKESNSSKAGIKAGDVITKIGDETIKDMDDVMDALNDAEEGDKVSVELIRKGKESTVSLEVSDNDYSDDFDWEGNNPGNHFQFHFQPPMDEMPHELERNMRGIPDIRKEIKRITIGHPQSEV